MRACSDEEMKPNLCSVAWSKSLSLKNLETLFYLVTKF